MPLLPRHTLPTGQTELADAAGAEARWDAYIRHLLAGASANLADLGLQHRDGGAAPPRFFDACVQAPAGTQLTLPILWNAFPKCLLSRFGRDKALQVADLLWPLSAAEDFDPLSPRSRSSIAKGTSWARPQDEYCEWRVERDPQTQRIRRIVFTTESPEYWWALHGARVMDRVRSADTDFEFVGSPEHAAAAYGRRLGHPIDMSALQLEPGKYSGTNRWNTSHGIVHLTHRFNNLCSLVNLFADCTVPRCHADGGGLLTHPEAVCCALSNGNPNNHSDSTIVGTVNALARQGAWLTLAEPLGVSIDHIDTNGWAWPDGSPAADCWHAVPDAPDFIQRLVIEPPAGCRYTLDQLSIGGEPLHFGGQVAECITVKAVATCVLPLDTQPLRPLPAVRRALLSDANRRLLHVSELDKRPRSGHRPAFLPSEP